MTFHFDSATAILFFLSVVIFPCHAADPATGGFSAIDEEFTFDAGEYEKSPVEFGGYLQLDASRAHFRKGSSLYHLNYFDRDPGSGRTSGAVSLHPEATWRAGSFRTFLRAGLGGEYGDGVWEDEFTLMEGNISRQVSPGVYISTGKILPRWGKGYAWNPVNFVGRDKNPSDPDLALEGFWMVFADVVFSFSGSLRTLAVTGVALPVADDVNEGFGGGNDLNWAGKVYLLLCDTDIDLVALAGGSRTARIGMDVSRNVTGNFEIHGEWALVDDFAKTIIAPDGSLGREVYDAESYLLGIRYLASTETTFIIEYYHNGQGYTDGEAVGFHDFIDVATDSETIALRDTSISYQRPNYGKDYIYLRASQKEPFGMLYLIPAVTAVFNLDDRSRHIIPEIAYTGITDLELRMRFNLLSGDDRTEYGERQNDWKFEARARYYF